MQLSGIYTIICVASSSRYYGQTQDLEKRWIAHRSQLKRGVHGNVHLQRAWDKYGSNAFRFDVVAYCDIDSLAAVEQQLLCEYVGDANCYNIAKDASAPMRGRSHTKQTRDKLSAALRGRKLSKETIERSRISRTGLTRTAEMRMKMSEACKKRAPLSRIVRAKIARTQRGSKRSAAALTNLSIGAYKRWQDPAYREKQTANRRTRVRSNAEKRATENNRQKASEKRWADPEARDRHSAALRASWQRRKALLVKT